ncbi:hypothetical protein SUGI_0538120 [Cryptomeria japonica]|nr:hypothetical protein SUGI_0538120 [Cryptomeria japonica]
MQDGVSGWTSSSQPEVAKEWEHITSTPSRDARLRQHTEVNIWEVLRRPQEDAVPVRWELLDLLLPFRGDNINVQNDEGMNALDIASAPPQDNPNCTYIVQTLAAAGAIRSSLITKSNKSDDCKNKKGRDMDTVNTHMIVASLIATVT